MTGLEPPAGIRQPKQEQLPASDEIVEVGPGVLRLQIPIRFSGLGHVNSYVLVDGEGAAVVDAGMPGRSTWLALQARLRAAGLKVRDIHTVMVTHSHPDHFGSAGLLAHESGADLVAEASFQTWFTRPEHADPAPGGGSDFVSLAGGTPWGGSPVPNLKRHLWMMRLARMRLLPYMRPPVPTRLVSGGDRLTLAGRPWLALHTPGHTGDHLCLYDPESKLLISGDHVLPTITPHVPGISPLADPLGAYMASLRQMTEIGEVRMVLPAHGHPFSDLAGRVDEILAHHDGRLGQIHDLLRTGDATVMELSREMFRKSRWGMMAESETYAHLEHLRLESKVERRQVNGQAVYSAC
ncbi:MAG: MBL fold metallo-hydrolase [Acidimicrobiales bacterium]